MTQAQARIDEPRQTQSRSEEFRQAQRRVEEKIESRWQVFFLRNLSRWKATRRSADGNATRAVRRFQEINQAWFDRARSAATINSELIAKLTSARTMPETAEAYQQCVGKRMEMLVEDGRRLLADSQKIVNVGSKFLTNGSGHNGSAA